MGEKTDRNARMLEMRLQGASYREIGEKFGVSRQRALQILSPPPEIRRMVVDRAGGQCEQCGIIVGRSGHVHHGHPTHRDGDWFNSPERLQLLCPYCHHLAHWSVQDGQHKGDVVSASPLYEPEVEREPFEGSP